MEGVEVNIKVEGDSVTWASKGLKDGTETLALMSGIIFDMYEYYFEHPARPELPDQNMRVCIELKDDAMGISYRPTADPLTALALCQAAACGIYRKLQSPNFDPMEGVLGALVIRN